MAGVSMKCAQCSKVKRCRMHIEEREVREIHLLGELVATRKVPVYLCAPCARELGYSS